MMLGMLLSGVFAIEGRLYFKDRPHLEDTFLIPDMASLLFPKTASDAHCQLLIFEEVIKCRYSHVSRGQVYPVYLTAEWARGSGLNF
ncbi:hypothetical protein ACOMHN_003973 [Nucella lapillus]